MPGKLLAAMLAVLPVAACVESGNDDAPVPSSTVDFDTGDWARANPQPPHCGAASILDDVFAAAEPLLARDGTLHPEYVSSARNRAEPDVLLEPRALFAAVEELIGAAQHEVALQTFAWGPGSDGARAVLAGMAEIERRRRAAGAIEPVIVRLLIDTMPTAIKREPPMRELLTEAVVEIEALGLDPRYVQVEVGTRLHYSAGSLHSKTLIVDGRRALVTSANLDPYNSLACTERQASFILEGDVALSLLAEFHAAWMSCEQWMCDSAPPPFDGEAYQDPCLQDPQPAPHQVAGNPVSAEQCRPALVLGRPWKDDLAHDPRARPNGSGFLAAFAAARESIQIRTPNLNAEAVKKALIDALVANPALRVRIVLSKGYEDTAEVLDGGTNERIVGELYDELARLGAAAPCERLQIRWYSDSFDGATPTDGDLDCAAGIAPSHVKYASIDGALLVIGSSNMDTQSWNRSREVEVFMDDPGLVAEWDRQVFTPIFATAVPPDACPR